MNMRHRRGQFDSGDPIIFGDLRDFASAKQDNAIRANRIRISQIGMASRRITCDYPELAAWFCLSVKPRSENGLAQALEDVDIEAVVPMRHGERIVKRHRIIKAPKLPVIPGYVLVRCVPSPAAMAGLVRFDKRVVGVVGGAETPMRIPLKFVDKFVEKAGEGAYDWRPPAPIDYAVDEQVRVCDGPFASFTAIVRSIDFESSRISVEVNIFGRLTPVELDVAQIEKL